EDLRAAAVSDAIFNRWFIEGITRQTYPAEVLEGLGPHMPKGWQEDMPLIGQKLDWLGVNYYTRSLNKAAPPGTPWPGVDRAEGTLRKTQRRWEIVPDGLEHLLSRMQAETGRLPLYVTEHGMASADEVLHGAARDKVREDFITAHLAA